MIAPAAGFGDNRPPRQRSGIATTGRATVRRFVRGWRVPRGGRDRPGGGPVRILTLPRMLGHVFNPISVWFGYGRRGRPRAVLYEVSNTFGQWHHHLVRVDGLDPAGNARHVFGKELFVSPFIDQEATYDFRVRPPDRAALTVREHVAAGQVLTATLVARRRGLGRSGLWRAFAHAPDGHAQGARRDPLGGSTPVAQGRCSARHGPTPDHLVTIEREPVGVGT